MRRSPAFDPPEYVSWTPDPDLVEAYRQRTVLDPEIAAVTGTLDAETLLGLYRDLLRTRLHDIGLQRWVKTGVISKAWLGTGEEAATVGPTRALDPGRDVIMPMIRNAGACPIMGMPLADMFRGYLATADAPNGGRDLHVGDPARGVLQPISHMGTNVPVMTGVALSFRQRAEQRVALTWIGDGATRTGECHEGANLAAVLNLPVVFVVQDNQVALGTRTEQHTRGRMTAWPDLYGIPSRACDGNNVVETFAAARLAVDACRRGEGPRAIVATTFRMGGHATHDEREARDTFDPELFAHWGRRDPVGLFESYLTGRGIQRSSLEDIENEVAAEVEAAAQEALESRDRQPEPETALYRGVSAGDPLVGLRSRPL